MFMYLRIPVIFCFFFLMTSTLHSQLDSVSNDSLSFVKYVAYDHVYVDRIKTVRLRAQGSEHPEPVIGIFAGSKLKLEFDDLSDDYIEYRYEIIHCNRNWAPSLLQEREFYEGFSSNILENYAFSNATKIDFTHYELLLPGNGERFLRSGNYLLHIYENETDSIVLTRRFMVVDPKLSIQGRVVRPDDVSQREYAQQIKFEVKDVKSYMQDLGNIYVRVNKNHSWEFYKDSLKPSFVNNDLLTFNRLGDCIFEAGNEYRFFNMIQFRDISNNVERVKIDNKGMYTLWLQDDEPRSYLQYSAYEDWNGKSIYTSDLKNFNPNELDYAMVNFSFKPEEIILGQEVYLYGEISDFRLRPDFKMQYNADKEKYELSKLLKQGLHNYQYVVESIYTSGPEESTFEGTHYETENDYTIYVYYFNAFEGVDELLGIERINSRIILDE